MPDDKPKSGPATAPAPAQSVFQDPFVEIVSALVALFVILYIVNAFIATISSSRFSSLGWTAFTPRGIYLAHSLPISALENPIGVRVFGKNDLNVYDSPNGNKIGEQKSLSKGKILQGPVEIDSIRFWYVDFDTNPDGWVRESSIVYLQSEPNLIERIYMKIFAIGVYVKWILIIFSILAILAIIYLFNKVKNLRIAERKLVYLEPKATPALVNSQWQRVLAHLDSISENDWRQAILEADIVLAGLLDKLFLPGETIGDKLKSVEKSDFTTVDNAWEAHKVRNQIAHGGEAFRISQKEAKRVIDLYKSVFEEFQII